jgi:hypothetical protein
MGLASSSRLSRIPKIVEIINPSNEIIGIAIPIKKRKKYNRLTGSDDGAIGGSLVVKKPSGAKKIAKVAQPAKENTRKVILTDFTVVDFISFTPCGEGRH